MDRCGAGGDGERAVGGRSSWALIVLALVGLAIMAVRRRFEAVVLGLVLAYMTAVGPS